MTDAEPPPIGFPVTDWRAARPPDDTPIVGTHCRLERLGAAHADDLFDAYAEDRDDRVWVYLPYGPFPSRETFRDWIAARAAERDPHFVAIVESGSERALGVASYLRIDAAHGVVEVGHVNFAPALQRGVVATEAMFLMMREAFARGYRRYEWKCDALNTRSRRAAERLGFVHEGVFRQATIYKGRNRDTAWYAVIDRDWPRLERAFERWLAPENFDAAGRQRRSLESLR